MPGDVVTSTMAGAVTLICARCMCSAGFDVEKGEYVKYQAYYDHWVCPECLEPHQKHLLKKFNELLDRKIQRDGVTYPEAWTSGVSWLRTKLMVDEIDVFSLSISEGARVLRVLNPYLAKARA